MVDKRRVACRSGGQEILSDDLGLKRGQDCRIGVELRVLNIRMAPLGEERWKRWGRVAEILETNAQRNQVTGLGGRKMSAEDPHLRTPGFPWEPDLGANACKGPGGMKQCTRIWTIL